MKKYSDEWLAATFRRGVLERALDRMDPTKEWRMGKRVVHSRAEASDKRTIVMLAKELAYTERELTGAVTQ